MSAKQSNIASSTATFKQKCLSPKVTVTKSDSHFFKKGELMPRIARFIETNGFYHILSRSINDNYILRDADDFHHFLKLAHAAKQKYPINIFHYIVMNTHFHLVAQAQCHKILSRYIAYLKWNYSMWMRKKYTWKGPLWRERYKSLPIENETYLYACGMYIEYNPVRAMICSNPAEYPYSSYKKYHLGVINTLLDDYEDLPDLKQFVGLDYTTGITKTVFSDSPAIGSSFFINKFSKNACPQK